MDVALRPTSFSEFVGQRKVAENLEVYVAAAKKSRGGTLDHVLLFRPAWPGQDDIGAICWRTRWARRRA